MTVDVYVDGSCYGYGSISQAGAGCGVWFGPYHELNFNCPVGSSNNIRGGQDTQSSQRAEIQAAMLAVIIASREKLLRLRIHTDSKYVLHGVSDGIAKWKKNDWLSSKGRPIVNKGDWINLDDKIVEYERQGGTLEWKYVKAHSGNIGNENADRLAKWAAVASYHFSQFLLASIDSDCPHSCCGCPGPNKTQAEQRRYAALEWRMLESRKKTSLQELMEERKINLP